MRFIKSIAVCLLLSLIYVPLWSQVNIISNVQGQSFFTLTDAYSFTSFHSGMDKLDGQFYFKLTTASTELVAEAESGALILEPGQVVLGSEVIWGAFKFGNAIAAAQLSQSGYLPAGEYIYCIEFREVQSGAVVGNSCIELNIKDLVGFQLLSPFDASEVCDPVTLSWMPYLTPGFQEFRYSIRLVKCDPGQSPIEALNINIPLLELFDYGLTHLPLDPSILKLEPKAQYAWQVLAWDKGEVFQKSEIWSFHYCDDSPITPPKNEKTYQYLATDYGRGNFVQLTDEILFAFDNRHNLSELLFTVNCTGLDSFTALRLDPVTLHEGLNFVTVKIDPQKMPKGERLILESEPDHQGIKHYLEFMVK